MKLTQIAGKLNLVKAPHTGYEAFDAAKKLKSSSLVIIWNGSEGGAFWAIEVCRAFKIPYVIIERGLLPQAHHYIVDSEGICCRSRSLGEPVRKKQDEKLNLNKVAFVMQLEFDTTMYHYCPFNDNEDFIDHYVKELGIPTSSVVVCPHPRNPNPQTKYLKATQSTAEECKSATLAIGVSSTTMYEIAFNGTPVLVVGDHPDAPHPLNRHENVEAVQELILSHQFSVHDNIQKVKEVLERTANE
jgi:hypothetical protein